MDDLNYLPLTELRDRIASGALSPVDLVEATFDRIDARDETVNAFVHRSEERALEAAERAARAVERGDELGPLHGVPVAIKDSGTPVSGLPTTRGSIPLENAVSDEDAVVVSRLEDAGAIVVGMTNTPEFCHKGTTDNPLHGTTVTPFATDRIAGGSSGGSAAAVAAGMVPVASGTDAGGSIRIPASACGVFGFYPSYGLVPFGAYPDVFETHTPFTCHGPLTRTVSDAAVFLDVIAGRHPSDPFAMVDRDTDFVDATDRGADGLSIAYSPDLGVFPVDPRVRRVVGSATDAFEAAGATVEPVEVGFERTRDELLWAWETGFATQLASIQDKLQREENIDLLGDHRDELTPEFVDYVERGSELSAMDFKRADLIRTQAFDRVRTLLADYDLLVTPTLAVPPFETELLGPTEVDGEPVDPLFGWTLTWLFNLTGHPAASVPAGFTEDDGLPVGLQIIGRRFDDDTVLAASAAFEAQRPWHDAYPPAALD